MDIVETENVTSEPLPPPVTPQEVKLVDIKVTNENIALNLMVSFLSVAQKRGVFSLDEASKIWECIQKFQTLTDSSPSN
jgi:hypothetical protein